MLYSVSVTQLAGVADFCESSSPHIICVWLLYLAASYQISCSSSKKVFYCSQVLAWILNGTFEGGILSF